MIQRKILLIMLMLCNTIAFAQFITTWETTTVNESITIPTFPGETYNYIVDWGDGSHPTIETANATHIYTVAGVHTVSITGTFPRIYFNNSADRNKILTIEQWGDNKWSSMNSAFSGCSRLNITNPNIDIPNLSNAFSCIKTFSGALTFNGDISKWDVSNIINMVQMFKFARSFNRDISKWNVAKVTSMFEMFEEASVFNQNIGSWDVGKVRNMGGMFDNAKAFNQDIGNWDVGEVTNMSFIFRSAKVFNQDIGNWDVSKVEVMNSMFSDTESFNQNIGSWDISKVRSMSFMFADAEAFNQDIGTWDVSNVVNMRGMFLGAKLSSGNYDLLLKGWSSQNLQPNINFDGGNSVYCTSAAARESIIDNYGWNIKDFGNNCNDYFITTWKTNRANESITIPTFYGETYNYIVDWGDGTDSTIETANATHIYARAGIHTVSITGVFPRIYFNNRGGKYQIETIKQWGNNKWSSMKRAFFGCLNLTITNPNIDVPDLSNAKDCSLMFARATNFNGDVTQWDTSNITNMSTMFGSAVSFNQDIGNWDVSKVTRMNGMFGSAKAFNQDISQWNTSSVTTMMTMFGNAKTFNQDISQWNTSHVTNLRNMFLGADSFDQNISAWDVSNVTYMNNMFTGAKLSTGNYDALLKGWSAQNLQPNIIFDGGNSTYCKAAAERATIIANFGWSITDGEKDENCESTQQKNTLQETQKSTELLYEIYPNPVVNILHVKEVFDRANVYDINGV